MDIKELLKELLNAIPSLIYWKDSNNVYLGGNQAFLTSIGFNNQENIVGKKDEDIYNNSFAEKVKKKDISVLSFGRAKFFEETINSAYYLTYKIPIYLNDSKADCILLSYSVNISEYQNKINLLHKEKKQLDRLIALVPEHFYWTDKNNVYLGCNDEQAKSARLPSREAIVGKTNFDLPWKDQAEEMEEMNNEVMKTGKILVNEEQGLVNGVLQTRLSKKVPLYDEQGEIEGVLGISVDITDRKNMEEKLLTEKQRAEAANQLKTEFIRSMEHDIRTPFTGIFSLADQLFKKEEDPRKKKHLKLVSESAKELLNYCNQILSFSSEDLLYKSVLEKPFNLRALLESLEKMEKPLIEAKGLVFYREVSDSVPAVLMGDDKRLERILINLLSNAVKFTQQGYVKLKVEVGRSLEKENRVILIFYVEDTGIGIPEDKQEIIYEKFVRLSPSNKGLYAGQGLGLPLVKKLVDELGGTLQVKSQIDKGSTFLIQLPFKLPLLGDETTVF